MSPAASARLYARRVRRVSRTVAVTGVAAGVLLTGVPVASAHTTSKACPTSTSAFGGKMLQQGSRGVAVARLQTCLGVRPTGYFGARTRAAVRAFQRAHRLEVDGVVGPVTKYNLARDHAWRTRTAARARVQQVSSASSSLGVRAVREASRHYGKPYRWGGAGPYSFDCSGLTQYVYGRLGVRLPHNSAAQYAVTRHVPRSQRRLGDLIFISRGGRIAHVGIYAGNGYWWVARRTGTTITKQRIYTSRYYVGRVR